MILTFKFIGYQSNNSYDFSHDFEKDEICKKDIYILFMEKQMNIADLEKIKFISNGYSLTDLEKLYKIELLKTIFVFTNDESIQEQLTKNIFINIKDNPKPSAPPMTYNPPSYNSFDLNLKNLPNEDEEEDIIQPTEEELIEINKKIIEIFKDQDFINLLRICINKPELLKLANGYLSSGNIIDKDFTYSDYESEEVKYVDELNFILENINNINFTTKLTHQNISSILNYFNGHINLTLRYIINHEILE